MSGFLFHLLSDDLNLFDLLLNPVMRLTPHEERIRMFNSDLFRNRRTSSQIEWWMRILHRLRHAYRSFEIIILAVEFRIGIAGCVCTRF
ncbi:hypothetical protein D3C76_1367610 [compost metagenome]